MASAEQHGGMLGGPGPAWQAWQAVAGHDPLAAPLAADFRQRFGGTPRLYRAPGRVNLIGEHTDYNDGFVLPAAIGFYTRVALALRAERRVRVGSRNLGETLELAADLGAPQGVDRTEGAHWSDYVRGVLLGLRETGWQGGADLLIEGDVPLGAGLSSSASLEVAVAYAVADAAGLDLERQAIARLCQRAENEVVGMRCGIMDQYAACCGRRDHALLIDCRSLAHEAIDLTAGGAGFRIVICNTRVRHHLAGGEYNQRRADCEAGVRLIAARYPQVRALRDAEMAMLDALASSFDPVVLRRCRHVVGECGRVLQTVQALRAGDLAQVGKLMAASHRSLRDDYEVSCPELDLMVELAGTVPGTLGARMTGGGFGGCTVNLVAATAVDEFIRVVGSAYQARTGFDPQIHVCSAADGAQGIDLSPTASKE
jgi:galactokinase